MRITQYLLAACIFFSNPCFSQKTDVVTLSFNDATLKNVDNLTVMPYNRLLQSAGKVVTFGDSSLENHALDLCVLPYKNLIAIEDRYGIAVLNTRTNAIKDRWTFTNEKEWGSLLSTYSGITSFMYKSRCFISWGAAGYDGKSFIMVASWNGQAISDVSGIPVETAAPADLALPNQVVANTENDTLYLYAVLNGNNRLLKLRFEDRKIMWSAPTGIAPFGLCIIGRKAYVTNWAGPVVTDTTVESAGTPWGLAYTNPVTGAAGRGSLSIIDITDGRLLNELELGLHPNAIVSSPSKHHLYIANANSDFISVIDVAKEKTVDSIHTGVFSKQFNFYGSSPNALFIDAKGSTLYVANGMDNAIAVFSIGSAGGAGTAGSSEARGYIPTEAYPSGIALVDEKLYVTNLEAKGSRVLSGVDELKQSNPKLQAYTIHKELASLSIIPVPDEKQLNAYTEKVKKLNLFYRLSLSNNAPRENRLPQPLPERIGEPSLFKHVIYIIKENKTYDQVFGDVSKGNGQKNLCIYGEGVTPNQHKLASEYSLLDNYYASGKSSAEGHQWTDAAMVSDYVERNVRAWFRSYPHRQEDALVYNKNGFIWNNALDHGKSVRIYGEACLTHYNARMRWADIYNSYTNKQPIDLHNTSTIARIRPVISPTYPDCDNLVFTDQLRASIFIDEWKEYEQKAGDSLPNLMVLSLPDDHTAGISPNFPTPRAMVADNDQAVGRIVETVTHSRFWDSTVIFVTEDDSQSGWDHISPYRTTCLVISPYSKLGETIHTNYNQTSMVRTIEQILGLPPMNVIDATALPMSDCFTAKKQIVPYTHITAKIPLNEMNKELSQLTGKAKYYARLSAESVFKSVDDGDDRLMNRILWFDAKGSTAYPVFK